MFVYSNHENGGLFFSDEEIDYEYLYCETCGDSDTLIGEANNLKEFLLLFVHEEDDEKLFNENQDTFWNGVINGEIYLEYNLDYLYPIICENFLDDKENPMDKDGFSLMSNEEIISDIKKHI